MIFLNTLNTTAKSVTKHIADNAKPYSFVLAILALSATACVIYHSCDQISIGSRARSGQMLFSLNNTLSDSPFGKIHERIHILKRII